MSADAAVQVHGFTGSGLAPPAEWGVASLASRAGATVVEVTGIRNGVVMRALTSAS